MTQATHSEPEAGQVLIAGASPAELDQLRRCLNAPGLTVAEESNIDQVRRDLAAGHFDCVLVDETLIRSQGMFFLTQGDWNQGPHAPLVILMTSIPAEHRELLDVYDMDGVDLLMSKPCAGEETLTVLCHMLQGRSEADPTHGACMLAHPADASA